MKSIAGSPVIRLICVLLMYVVLLTNTVRHKHTCGSLLLAHGGDQLPVFCTQCNIVRNARHGPIPP